jgi:hypothetical protein
LARELEEIYGFIINRVRNGDEYRIVVVSLPRDVTPEILG